MRFLLFVCLCLALVAAPVAAERTLFVDFVEPSATTATLLETVTADVLTADSATVGELLLNLPDGLNIATVGDVSLSGSFLDFQSSSNTIVNANADIVTDSSSRTSIAGETVNFNVGDDFLLSSRAGEVTVTSHSSLTADSDEQFITSDGGVTLDAGAGSIDVFADDLVLVDGVNTELWGANRVSIFAQNGISATAEEDLEVVSDTIDLDSLGDFVVQSTAGNVRFIGGDRFVAQAEVVNANAEDGIDITSRHADVFVSVDGGAFITGENVNFVGEQDVIFTGEAVAVNAVNFDSRSLKSTNVVGTTLTTDAGDDLTVDTGAVYFDIDENINMSLNGAGGVDTFAAGAHIEIRSYDVNIVTSDFSVDATDDADVFFSTLQDADSTLTLTGASASIDANLFVARSSSVSITADDFDVNASDDVILLASTSVDDALSISADDISFNISDNLDVEGELSNWIATTVTLTAVDNLFVAAGQEPEEILSITTDTFEMTGAVTHVGAGRDIDVKASSMTLSGAGSFLAESGENIDLEIAEGVTFDALVNFAASGYNTDLRARIFQAVDTGDVSFSSADETNVVAGNIGFGALDQFAWTSDRSVQFDAFGDIVVDDIDSITGGAVSFEGFNSVAFDADSITFISTVFSASSGAFQDIVWDGTLLDTTGTVSHSIIGNDVVLSGSTINIIGSRDNQPGSVSYLTTPGSGDSITFTAAGEFDVNMNDGSNFVNAADVLVETSDLTLFGDDSVSFSALRSLSFSTSAFVSMITDNLEFSSGQDVSFETVTDSIQVTGSSASFNVARAINVGHEGALTFQNGGDSSVASQGFVIIDNSAAPADSNSVFEIDGDDLIINATTFRQTGATDTTVMGSSITTAKDRVSVNSIVSSDITATNFEFSAPNTGDSVRFESRGYDAISNTGNVRLTGGDVLIANGEAQTTQSEAVAGILLETNNGFGFTWNTADDFNSTAGFYTITAQTTSPGNMGVRFLSTHEQGDIVTLARNGELQLVAPESHNYNAGEIQLYAAADAYFGNSISPSAGGVTLTAAGAEYDAAYGDDVGAMFRTSGDNGFIHILPNEGAARFDAADDIEFVTTSGALNVVADEVMSFATVGDIQLESHFGAFSLVADRGDVPITTPLDIDIETSAGVNFAALDTVRLTAATTGDAASDNGIGLEFVAHTGHVSLSAESNNNVEWVAAGDFLTQAAGQVSLTATANVDFTATAGKFHFHGDTGLGYYVQNGDLDLTASDNVAVSSSPDSYINVASGLNSNWVAQAGSVSITSHTADDQFEPLTDQGDDQTGIAMRTERNDLTFDALNGDINYLSSGRIQVQADGTANNIGGADSDGVFLVAPQINSLSTHETVWDAEGIVRIGANTSPIVTIQAGGDTRASGVTITSEGGAAISTNESFLINSGGDFATASVLTSDFSAGGDILITSTGTSPTGRDATFSTLGNFDIDSNTLAINGRDSAFVSSAGVLSLLSTGNDPTSAFIEFTSVSNMFININGTTDVDVDTWSITATESFAASNTGFVSFSNVNGANSGSVAVQADAGLNFASDSAQHYVTSEGDLSIATTASNADISIDAAHPTSDVLFHAGNAGGVGFEASAVDEIDVDTTANLSITARDQDDDDTEDGNITLTASTDFSMDAKRDLLVEGALGLSIATTNPAGTDIDIESDGFAFISSWEAMTFQSTADSMDIAVENSIAFSTNDFQEGEITVSSTRDVSLTVDSRTVTDISGDSTYTAGTVHWRGLGGDVVFETDGNDAQISGTAEDGSIVVAADGELTADVGSFEMSATGQTFVTSTEGELQLTTDSFRNNIELTSEAGLLSVTAVDSISLIAGVEAEDNTRGLGYVDFTSQGVHPTDGYGFRIESTETLDVTTEGPVSFLAGEGVTSISAESFSLVGQGRSRPLSQQLEGGSPFIPQLNDGNAVIISAQGVNGNVNVTAEGIVRLRSGGTANLRAEVGVEFDGIETDFSADSNMLIQTTHPYAHLLLTATDFLVGEINIDADSSVEIYGHSGVNFELQDDDDQSSSAEFVIDAENGEFSGRNDVRMLANGGGDIVVDTGDSFTVLAGGDVLLNVRQAIEVDASDLTITANGPVVFNAGSGLEVDSEGSFTATGSGLFTSSVGSTSLTAGDLLTINAGDTVADELASPNQQLSVSAANDIEVDVNNINFELDLLGSVDFRDGIIIPFSSSTNTFSTGSGCSQLRSMFYSPLLKQLCYCTDNGELSCQFMFETDF